MGNCAETCKRRGCEEICKEPEAFRPQEIKNRKTAARGGSAAKISVDPSGKIDGGGGGRVRVKILLTKEELELLLIQLGRRKGGPKSNLEQVLGEIERGRRRNSSFREAADVGSWKPSLDSIMEVPEVPEMERRS